jgi:hypothetical protein
VRGAAIAHVPPTQLGEDNHRRLGMGPGFQFPARCPPIPSHAIPITETGPAHARPPDLSRYIHPATARPIAIPSHLSRPPHVPAAHATTRPTDTAGPSPSHFDVRAPDAVPDGWRLPRDLAEGKSTALSLMQPQTLAKNLLPARTYEALIEYSVRGVPTDCGDNWPLEALESAKAAGPHVSALTPENTALVWDEVQYQLDAGFVRCVPEHELFGPNLPAHTKISRLAVVPQRNRRGRLILNLSADVELPSQRTTGSRRKTTMPHPSVNTTTVPATDQTGVQNLGTTMPGILAYMHDVPCHWEIRWSKIDLSDGFWRMIVQAGQEHNFVYEMPPRPNDTGRWFVIPSALQMGWKNSPAYFCNVTEAGREITRRLLALSFGDGLLPPHELEHHCAPTESNTNHDWRLPTDVILLVKVFVDDYVKAVAGPTNRPSRHTEELWLARAVLHAIHSLFPSPRVTNHTNGRDSVSLKKLLALDGLFDIVKTILGFLLDGHPGSSRTVGLPTDKADGYIAAIQEALDCPRHFISYHAFQKIHGKLVHASAAMPCMGGFMTNLNQLLASPGITVGLGKNSALRSTLHDFTVLLRLANTAPLHITELVGSDLPHIYGYTDASRVGMGGVIMPATRWTPPTVWRAEFR